MRFDTLTLKNLGSLSQVELDFREMPAGIIAVCGANGSGKTTLLGALLGGIYRDVPTRGSLADLATTRDCRVSVGITHGGKGYLLTQLADCVSRKGEATVAGGGTLLVDSGKVSDVADWVAKTLPSLDLVLASMFTAQRSRGFLDLKPSQRKDLLLELLGIGRLENMAKVARAKAALVQLELRHCTGKLELVMQAADVNEATAASEAAQHGVDQAAKTLSEARLELERLTIEHDSAVEANDALGAAREHVRSVAREWEASCNALGSLERRLPRLRELTSNAEAIRAAALRAAKNQEQRAEFDRRERAVEAARKAAARYGDLEDYRASAAALPGLEKRLEEAEEAHRAVADDLRALRGRQLLGAGERIGLLQTAIEAMVERSENPSLVVEIGSQALEVDKRAEREAGSLPGQIEEGNRLETETYGEVVSCRGALQRSQANAEHLPAVEAAYSELEAARAHLAELGEPGAYLVEDNAAAQETARLAAQVEDLARAEATLAELEPQLAAAEERHAKAKAELEAVVEPSPPLPVPDLAPARQRVAAAEAELRRADQRCALAIDAVKRAQEAAEQAVGIRNKRLELELESSDWMRLGADLGKDGLQAMLVDAALPELSATTNELLREAFGPRFSVELRTQAADAKGKRLLETLDVAVLDSERGRDTVAETLSGGEQTIVAEALSLALAMVTLRAAGISECTLVRDESGAALDAEKAASYVRMLRRAQQIIGARQVLLVSHASEVQELCDARIVVANGTAETNP